MADEASSCGVNNLPVQHQQGPQRAWIQLVAPTTFPIGKRLAGGLAPPDGHVRARVGLVLGGDRAVEIHVLGDGVRAGEDVAGVVLPIGVGVPRGEPEGHAVGGVLDRLGLHTGVGDDRRHVRPPVLQVVAAFLERPIGGREPSRSGEIGRAHV